MKSLLEQFEGAALDAAVEADRAALDAALEADRAYIELLQEHPSARLDRLNDWFHRAMTLMPDD